MTSHKKISVLSALSDNYIYIIHDQNSLSQKAIVIDPGDANPVIDFAQRHSCVIDSIMITHHHYDHIDGIGALKEVFPDAKIYGPEAEKDKIPHLEHALTDNMVLEVLGHTCHVISTPGHTAGQINYFFPELLAYFSGDTLFSLGCGRIFDGSIEALFDSCQNLLQKLPDNTRMYPGHEYTLVNFDFARQYLSYDQKYLEQIHESLHQRFERSGRTIPSLWSFEKNHNPFLVAARGEQHQARLSMANAIGMSTDNNISDFDVFKRLRELRNSF